MKVTSHRKSWDGIHGIVDLRPGVNEVDADLWARVAKDPEIQGRIARGEYVIEAMKPAPVVVAPAPKPPAGYASDPAKHAAKVESEGKPEDAKAIRKAEALPEPEKKAAPAADLAPAPAPEVVPEPVEPKPETELKSKTKAKSDKAADDKKPSRSRGKRS